MGITSELQATVFQHKNKLCEGSFTANYRFDMLVYIETFSDPSEVEWMKDESWKAIPEAKFRPVLRWQPRKS